MKYYAIIVAGGSGSRMQNSIPKQFLLLDGKPLIMHTLEAFYACKLNPQILLVLNIDQHKYWKELCLKYNFTIPHQVIAGGIQRFHSVQNGLLAIEGDGTVAIHDAVRPLVSASLITRCFLAAEETGNCIVGITPTDSVRKISDDRENEAISREQIVLIQTPQTFDLNLLRKAYQTPYQNEFTDDASVLEYAGFKINLIPGERENIKITYPEDMEIASFLRKRVKGTD